jgi:uncharacterized protein
MALEITSITSLLTHWSTPRLRALFAEDPRQAAQWASVLADEGLAAAQLCFGRMLLEGTGTPRDSMAALKWLRRAADNGDIDAVNMVGRCLDNGWGTAEDPAAAAAQYRRAADVGHAWAQYNLGHLYLDGRGVVRDVDQAYGCYLRAASQGHERAMNLVGRCCEEGWGTPRDPAAAADWYRRSAEAGYFRGQYNWATLLLRADRPDEAAVWFERAASNGTPGVRSAVIDTIERKCCGAGTDGALQRLAARLKNQSTAVASGH